MTQPYETGEKSCNTENDVQKIGRVSQPLASRIIGQQRPQHHKQQRRAVHGHGSAQQRMLLETDYDFITNPQLQVVL